MFLIVWLTGGTLTTTNTTRPKTTTAHSILTTTELHTRGQDRLRIRSNRQKAKVIDRSKEKNENRNLPNIPNPKQQKQNEKMLRKKSRSKTKNENPVIVFPSLLHRKLKTKNQILRFMTKSICFLFGCDKIIKYSKYDMKCCREFDLGHMSQVLCCWEKKTNFKNNFFLDLYCNPNVSICYTI